MATPNVKLGNYRGNEGNLGVNASTLKRDVVDKLFRRRPDVAPLTLFLREIQKKTGATAKSFKHEWAEDIDLPDHVIVSGALTAGDTALVVDDDTAQYVGVGYLLQDQLTREVVRVTAINTSTHTLTITRSFGGTAAGAIADNEFLTILGGAAAEGATSENTRARDRSWAHNFTQIFRNGWGVTGTLDNTDNYAEDEMSKLQFDWGMEQKKDIERALFFGERGSDTSGNNAIRSLGGMYEFISTSTTAFGGSVTWPLMQTASETDFEFGASKKWLYAARPVASQVGNIAEDYIQNATPSSTMGVRVSMITTQHGDYMLVSHPLFKGDENAELAFCIDPNNVAYVPLQNRDTMLRKNIQTPSADAREDEWLTEATLRRQLEMTHGLWTGIT